MPQIHKLPEKSSLEHWAEDARHALAAAGATVRRWWLAMLAWLAGVGGRAWHGVKSVPRAVTISIGAVLVVVIAIVVFLAQPNWDWARPTVASIIAGKVHRPVRIDGHLRVHLFSFMPRATLGGLHIGEPAKGVTGVPKDNLADINAINVQAELMPMFVGRIVLPRLEIDRPVVVLYQDAAGHANWDFSNGSDAGKATKLPPIKNFIITDGHLAFNSLQRRLSFTGTVSAREQAGAGRQAFELIGDGSLNGKVFQMNATGGPLLNVRSSVPYPFGMTVRAGDTHITAYGRVLHPFDLGQLGGDVTLSGGNLADLYYLTGLTLPDTPAYSLSAQVTRSDRVYDIRKINGRVGHSDLEGTLKVTLGEKGRPDLTGDLSSRRLDFKDLGSLFGATAANAPHAPELKADPNAAQAANRLLPDVPLDVERVRGMDAKVRYRALSVQAGANMPLRQVTLGVGLDHGLLTLDPIDMTFPQGRLTGNARINAREAVQTDAVDFRVTGVAVQDFLPQFQGAKPLEGKINARVKASGTGNTVHKAAATADGEFAVVMAGGTIRQSLAELLGIDATKGLFLLLAKDPHQTDVRCAVADFTVSNGVMQARQIVFDTGVVVVNGKGSVNLNDESMRFVLDGKAKKFRLIRLKAPILVGGHLSHPTVGVSTGPIIAQGGFAAVLNSVSPILAAVPFLNLNGAPDANCPALISEAQAQGSPPVGRK